jgi:predicted hotdog family 3-hydroxylacyl-ACP dehydratase
MRLDRRWIAAHVPHAGRMCLLDEVMNWSAERISCRSGTHRAPDHPLRSHGRLGAVCGIEYAAQAMAVHGALIGADVGGPARAGLLASVRSVRLHVTRLDDVESDLFCDAVRMAGERGMVLYEFEVRSAQQVLLHGRAAVVLDIDAGRRA